ncbi:MAG: DUF7149 domain-containing protein [Ignavibacteriaceae bacterium]
MNLSPLTPKQSLNKAYLKEKVLRVDIEKFKSNLENLLHNIDHEESEENVKNHLKEFLNDTYYKNKYLLNTKGNIDLAVYTDNKQESKVGVLFEVKKPDNKTDMVSKANLNAKAMHQLILYYLEERIEAKNNDIRFLIATNIYEWFIFDASLFEDLFYKNKSFVKEYEKWKAKLKVKPNTDLFYNEIAKPFLDALDKHLTFTYFNFEDYIKDKRKEDDKKLIALYKLLSPVHLLKQPFANDSNSLDKNFYNELLHLIGLEEIKVKNKKIIQRKEAKKRNTGSLIENAIQILETDSCTDRIAELEKYGSTKDEQNFNVALELCITWVNRILFLKLLEAQLYKYHLDDKYKFLNPKTITDFDELYKLFHQVLAVPLNERREILKDKYEFVPYLNSSLFEISELEHETIKINSLDHNSPLELYSNTVLKDKFGKKRTGSLPALYYFFEFLDAYDFTSEGKEDIQEDNKTLINASVLGLIFEKINGYKDGSYFTPGFITMYMSRETIRRAVIQKFNENYNWNCEIFDDLKNHLASRQNTYDVLEFNSLINSLKICDPAVGSGHFLVSALNEIIEIKSELGILADDKGVLLSGYDVNIENDELIITTNNGEEIFEYHHPIKGVTQIQRVQKTFFHEKQTIIENCLFGVDINPNSVKIARLRLWIELLKNAYYTEESKYKELETLPNIDINIKEGNSLISRFDLADDYSKLPLTVKNNMKFAAQKYKDQVFIYKNTSDKETRNKADKEIKNLKKIFSEFANPTDKDYVLLKKKENELGEIPLLFDRKEKEEHDKKVEKLAAEVDELRKRYEEKQKTIYGNAFEWRFEFPEVLDEEGRFTGFDIVIGNPPYGVNLKMNEKIEFKKRFNTKEGELEIYSFFIEVGLNSLLIKNGILSYITSNTWYYLDKFSVLRKEILLKYSINILIELEKLVFADAPDIVPAIFIIKKQLLNENIRLYKAQNTQKQYDLTYFNGFTKNIVSQNSFMKSDNFVFHLLLDNKKQNLLNKIKLFPRLNENYKIVYGIKTGDNKSNISKEIKLTGNWKKCASSANNISKYNICWNGDYLNVGKHLQGLGKINYEQPKILIQYIRKLSMPTRLVCALDEKGEFYPLNNFSFIISDDKYSLVFLLGILNSKMINWYYSNTFIDYNIKPKYLEKIPIIIDNSFLKDIETVVKKIISAKKRNQSSDISALEGEIDQIVYKLYGLTEEERRIVENK